MATKQTCYSIPVYRVALVRERGLSQLKRPQFTSPQQIAAMLSAYLKGADREHFVVLLLNTKNRLIGINTVSIGSLSSSLAHPREVLKPAILANADGIVVAHNHPSGDVSPSADDLRNTAKLKAGAKLLGIELLDHIIIGEGGRYYSFKEEGAWPET